MKYAKILTGIFRARPNRFLARVEIDGSEELVHVRNTGRCKELLIPGARVLLEDCAHLTHRKTKYSLVAVWKGDMLVNIDSQVPNLVVYDALKAQKIPSLKNAHEIKREVSYQNSRFDLYLETPSQKCFIEVKGVTLERRGLALFPDAPTSRGTKHVQEMAAAVEEGYRGILFFLIQMEGPSSFHLNWSTDQEFAQAVQLAWTKGVEILVYDSLVTPEGIELGQPIDFDLNIKS